MRQKSKPSSILLTKDIDKKRQEINNILSDSVAEIEQAKQFALELQEKLKPYVEQEQKEESAKNKGKNS